MILVTGAGGKTGLSLLKSLTQAGASVRAMIRGDNQRERVASCGVQEIIQGDLLDPSLMKRAVQGVKKIYHIPPNVHPLEVEIGRICISAAQAEGVDHFVYHSVLHPQLEAMPHHWLKMRVEETLIESGLSFTILQPTAYMQNLLAQTESIMQNKTFRVPYPVETRISLVDLEDVADAATKILTEAGHEYAVYELVGTAPLMQTDLAQELGRVLGFVIKVEEIPLKEWVDDAEATGLGSYQIDTLMKMFQHYQAFGLEGNPNILSWLLDRPPSSMADFIQRSFLTPDQPEQQE